MKLAKIHIEKFRGINKANIDVEDQLALVGQNNAGKSSILRALNAFFNFEEEKKHFEESKHNFTQNSQAVIELQFSNIPKDCTLSRTVKNGNIIRVRLKYRVRDIWQIYNTGKWERLKEEELESLKKYIRYVYISTDRNENILQWGPKSILKDAVMTWVQGHTKKRDTITPKVSAAALKVRETVSKGLNENLRKFSFLPDSFKFELDHSVPLNYELLIQNLTLQVVDGSRSFDITDCGSGVQSLVVIGLYSYLAETLGITYILGIEEPEQNLHPQAQESLLVALKKTPTQVLFTTHSTVMIDSLDHEEVVLCRRCTSPTRGFEITVTQLPKNFWANKNIDKDKYYKFHRRRNSDFFFADYVVLTESPIDAAVVRHLAKDGGLDFSQHSISIINLDGVAAIPYAYHLLKALKINFASVVDKDYFLPYKNDALKESRDKKRFPLYKNEYQRDCLINHMIPDKIRREKLLNCFFENHSKSMIELEACEVFCFRYSMDIDLVGSTSAMKILFNLLKVPSNNRSSEELLTKRSNQIKKQETLIQVIEQLTPNQLPNSYRKIRNTLPKLVQKAMSYR